MKFNKRVKKIETCKTNLPINNSNHCDNNISKPIKCSDDIISRQIIINNNTSGGGGVTIDLDHNNLDNLQGGNSLERYHIDKNIYDSLQGKNLNSTNKVVTEEEFNNISTNLSIGDINELTVEIVNDSGTGVILPTVTSTKAGVMSAYDKQKLDIIEQGAQKNVKSDWDATSGDSEILNKPTSFPPSPHTHEMSDVLGLQSALNLKEDISNKRNTLASPNNNTYPTTLAVVNALQEISSPVTSVNGEVGDVIITKDDIGLSQVDNTSDMNKPISTATQTVLNNKIDIGEKGAPNGVASLDGDGLIPVEQLPPHSHTPPDISIGQNLFLVGDVNGVGSARKILPSDVNIFVPNGVAISNSTGSDNWQIRQADVNPTALTIPIRSSTGRLKVGDATEFNDAVTLTQLTDGLFTKVDKTTTVSGSGGITIGGSLESGAVSIGVNDTYFNNKYLRKDVSDNNGSNTLTLGKLITPDASIGQLELNSLGTGTGTDEILVIDSSGIVKKKSAASDVNIGIANNLGANQFFLGSTSQLQFEGAGDTSISFNPATNKVTITSIPGAGGGGAVTSFNGRTGGVSPELGDYSTTMVTEGTNLYFTEGRVRLTPLTGLSNSNTPITATDNVLQGFGKLQGQMNTKASSSRNLTVSGTAGRIIVGGGTQDLSADREWTVDLIATGVSAGVYTKVAVDSYGRVYTGGMLTVSDIPTNLPYRSDSWVPTWTEVTGKPTFSTVATSGSYADLLNKPTSFPPSAHTHPISQIIDLQTALDSKAAITIDLNQVTNNGASTPSVITAGGFSTSGFIESSIDASTGNQHPRLSQINSLLSAKADVGGGNATGTWPISITGSANRWGNQLYDGNSFVSSPDWGLLKNSVTGAWQPAQASDMADFVRSGATGTWPINVTGDAQTWRGVTRYDDILGNGYVIDGVQVKIGNTVYPMNSVGIKEFIGIPLGGETLQSVAERGNAYDGTLFFSKMKSYSGDVVFDSGGSGNKFRFINGYIGVGKIPTVELDVNGRGLFAGTLRTSHTTGSDNSADLSNLSNTGYGLYSRGGGGNPALYMFRVDDYQGVPKVLISGNGDFNVEQSIYTGSNGNSTQWNQAYANSHAPDTLQSVTARGSTTTNPITINSGTAFGISFQRSSSDIGQIDFSSNNLNISAVNNLILNPDGGNVGIGTINPTEKLQVTGTIKGEGYVTHNINGSWSSYIAVGNELRWYSNEISAGDRMTLNTSGDLNVTGIISATGGNSTQWNQAFADRVTTNTQQTITGEKTFTQTIYGQQDIIAYSSSDKRLKKNLIILDKAIKTVNSLTGYEFEWIKKQPRSGKDYGVIAQEVEKVLPHAVVTRENGFKAVDYQKIIPVLIEAIKELTKKVEDLENGISK